MIILVLFHHSSRRWTSKAYLRWPETTRYGRHPSVDRGRRRPAIRGRIGRYVETGDFHYRYIIHGPFVQHVDHLVFSLFGANDFTLRLVVAVVGAALPLVVLLFREHLDGTELVVAALFLAGNPILLYYSRFFRSTVPVAVFAFAAFGFAVRYWDTRRARYLYGFSVLLALAFTAKENAAVYVLVWLGASGLLLDHELFRPRSAATGTEVLRDWWDRNVRRRELLREVPEVDPGVETLRCSRKSSTPRSPTSRRGTATGSAARPNPATGPRSSTSTSASPSDWSGRSRPTRQCSSGSPSPGS